MQHDIWPLWQDPQASASPSLTYVQAAPWHGAKKVEAATAPMSERRGFTQALSSLRSWIDKLAISYLEVQRMMEDEKYVLRKCPS